MEEVLLLRLLTGIRERLAAVPVRIMMPLPTSPRALAAAAAGGEIRIVTTQTMAPVAPVVALTEMAAAAAAPAVMLLSAEPEARGEPRVLRVLGPPVAVAAREAITSLGAPAEMPDSQEAAPVTEVQRVQHSPKRDRVEEPLPVALASLESVPAVVVVVANTGSKSSRHCFWDLAAAVAAAMTMARSVEGTEETEAGSFSLSPIL